MTKKSNLVSLADRTPEERKEIATKGGKARVAQKLERKRLTEELRLLLAEETPQGELVQTKLLKRLIEALTKGNITTQDITRLAEILGESDKTDKAEVTSTETITNKQLVTVDFTNWDLLNLEYVAEGNLYDLEEVVNIARLADKHFIPYHTRNEEEERAYQAKVAQWQESHLSNGQATKNDLV